MFRSLVAAFALVLALVSPVRAETLKMGILPVLDTLPLQVGVREGLFKAHGLDVELVPFQSAMERDTAMQSGRLDGYFGDLVATVLLIQRGVHMRIATVSWATSLGQPMFALLAAPGQDLAEGTLKTGISRATIIEYLLDSMRELPQAKDLLLDPVVVKKIPIRLQMLLANQIGAALLPEPLATLAETKGAEVLVTDEELGMPLTVLCLHDSRKALIPAFLRAYDAAVKRINLNRNAYRPLMVETCRIPKALAEEFPVYAYPLPRLPSREEMDRVQKWMVVKNMLKQPLPYESMIP